MRYHRTTPNGRYIARWFLLAILCSAIASFSLTDYSEYHQDISRLVSSQNNGQVSTRPPPELQPTSTTSSTTTTTITSGTAATEIQTQTQTHTQTGTEQVKPISDAHSDINNKTQFKLSFNVESREICPFWTYNWTLFPNNENKVEYTRIDANIVQAQWQGKFTVPLYFPFGETCVNGRPLDASEKEQPVNYTAILCGSITADQPEKQKLVTTNRTTFVMRFGPEFSELNDILDDNTLAGLNIWHFHAQYIPIWLGLRLVEVTAYLMPSLLQGINADGVYPTTFPPMTDILFIFPDSVWHRFTKPDNPNPVVLKENGANIKELHKQGGHECTLAGLQAIQDGFPRGSRVMAATYSMTVEKIQAALIEHGMNHRPKVYFRPPHRGTLLWKLANPGWVDMDLHCSDSVLKKYVDDLLGSVKIEYDKIARHVCLVSRQIRTKPEHRHEDHHSAEANRNLMPHIYETFLRRLPSLLVLQFNQELRNPNENEMTNRSSITGQMRLVRNKCAVMVGVHGAGLTHVFAMRPGTHLVEFQGNFVYSIFRNSASLLPNVSHEVIRMNSTVTDERHYREANFTTTDDELESIVQVITQRLSESIQRQTQLSQ